MNLLFTTISLLIGLTTPILTAKENSTMWYDKPADGYRVPSPLQPWTVESQNRNDKGNPDTAWERHALPVGNGFIGAMIYGNVEVDRIQFNEHSLWSGGPGSSNWMTNNNKMDAAQHLPAIRKSLLEGDHRTAQSLSTEHLRGLGPENRDLADINFGLYQTFGEFTLKTGHKNVENYRRDLNLSSGIASVSYQHDGANFRREYFCSFPDKCLVAHYESDQKAQQNLFFKCESPHLVSQKDESGVWVIGGKVENNGLLIEARVGILHQGGSVTLTSDGIQVTAADQVTFIIVAGTDYAAKYPHYRGESPTRNNRKTLKSALEKGFSSLKKKHIEDHRHLHGRVAIDLGKTPAEIASLPLDQRLYHNRKTPDHDLEELYFQFGRYLLIASSREGSLPANLQGIWCNECVPAWNSDYHLNINLQINYWPAGPCNLSECQKPLISFIDSLRQPGATTAKAYSNARGWTSNLTSNIWGFTQPNPGKSRPRYWAYFPISGSWLATHAWEQYSFDQDKDYLKSISWPILSGAADFLVDHLYQLPNGEFTSIPSWSPEHGPISKGTTCDIAIAREALTNAVNAAKVLGEKGPRIEAWKKTLNNLVPYKIGKHGQLQEWYEDIDSPKDKHRHINHLFGTYPGHQINLLDTPKLAAATEQVMMNRGYGIYGWSIGWQINLSARLRNGERCYEVLRNLLTKPTKPNFLNVKQTFQIDGNLGGTSGIAEMLIQSRVKDAVSIIDIIPALPPEWSTGFYRGLRARGGITVDVAWRDSKVFKLRLTADKATLVTIHANGASLPQQLQAGKTVTLTSFK